MIKRHTYQELPGPIAAQAAEKHQELWWRQSDKEGRICAYPSIREDHLPDYEQIAYAQTLFSGYL